MMSLLAVFDLAEPERSARLREARIAAVLLCGAKHPFALALADAIADPASLSVVQRGAVTPTGPRSRKSNTDVQSERNVAHLLSHVVVRKLVEFSV
jgi:hypothetical protein